MQLEIGDYFVITRGELLQTTVGSLGGMPVAGPIIHDATWHNTVLMVCEIEEPMVVAEIVGLGAGAAEHPSRAVGRRHVFDLRKIRWCLVGKRFAQLLAPAAPPAMTMMMFPTERQARDRIMGLAVGEYVLPAGPERRDASGGGDERDQT